MIKLVTDSSAGLPEHIVERYDIRVVPAALNFGGQRVRAGSDITAGQLYAYMAGGGEEVPEPAAPAVGDFIAIYDQLIADAPTATIFSVHPAAALSSTLDAARRAAAEFIGADIRVVDSGSALLGQGIMTAAAADLAGQGADASEVGDALERWAESVQAWAVVPGWPRREGQPALLRLGEDGIVIEAAFDALDAADAALHERALAGAAAVRWLGVQHAARPQAADALGDALCAASPDATLLRAPISPLFGVTLGVGAVAVAWLPAE